MEEEVYYLSSLESERFETTRECVFLKRLRFNTGKECALVRLSPAIIGQDFGVSGDISIFVVANRHKGEGLTPIRRFPCFIHVARLLIRDIESKQVIAKEDLQVVGWCELYRTRDDADQHVFD